jgi:hypothetical protein
MAVEDCFVCATGADQHQTFVWEDWLERMEVIEQRSVIDLRVLKFAFAVRTRQNPSSHKIHLTHDTEQSRKNAIPSMLYLRLL